MPFSFENRVGRLLEVTITGSLTLDDAQAFRTKMFLTLSGMQGRAVLCGELRKCHMFNPEIGEKMVAMLKADSPKVERSAFLVAEGPLAKQIERIVAEAAREAKAAGKPVPPRQCFRDVASAHAWLGEVLNDAERARLAQVFPV